MNEKQLRDLNVAALPIQPLVYVASSASLARHPGRYSKVMSRPVAHLQEYTARTPHLTTIPKQDAPSLGNEAQYNVRCSVDPRPGSSSVYRFHGCVYMPLVPYVGGDHSRTSISNQELEVWSFGEVC